MEAELDLVFLWHMHQPDYRAPEDREFTLPWVYLHALKDYSDMAAHLERHPAVHAVVNFVPVLLEQIEDYAAQFRSGQLRDPLLRLLVHPEPQQMTREERHFALASCFRSNDLLMIQPFPAYKRLHDVSLILEDQGDDALDYLSGAYFSDLVTWYHLVWTGETLRRQYPLLAELMARGTGYGLADRQALSHLIGDVLENLIPRYRALEERGQIEMSSTPYAHPLAPLLLDFKSAHEAMPDAPLPVAAIYPGGSERVDAHIDTAIASHETRFGKRPAGIWPAEGAVSAALISQLATRKCAWSASGEGVLKNSVDDYERSRDLYRPYRLATAPETVLFFRDDKLSDLIGFEYAKWQGNNAVDNFIGELDAIRRAAPPEERLLVSVILDGENAWEFYPYNAYYFFEDLYQALEGHATIHTHTYTQCLADKFQPERIAALTRLTAGSWVYGTFSTWIGSADKNRAWDLLADAKQAYDSVIEGLDPEASQKATGCLAVCESSDWFWWLGDYNPADTVTQFDALFRRNLRHLYELLRLHPPETLDVSLAHGGGAPESAGTMRRGSE